MHRKRGHDVRMFKLPDMQKKPLIHHSGDCVVLLQYKIDRHEDSEITHLTQGFDLLLQLDVGASSRYA